MEKNIDNNQQHLNYINKINLGAFYTPLEYVEVVWKMIDPFINNKTVILDSSCGYGNFFKVGNNCRKIGNDIDLFATVKTKKNIPNIETYNKNSLVNVSRSMFKISKEDNLIIIGNPPYNDTTSIIRNEIKTKDIEMDLDIKTRDYGISFLLSYNKLEADFVCVLHPLSYLVKKTNFNLLKDFTKNYKLIDGLILDSKNFKETSKSISFPIIIGLYKKDSEGMNFDYILNYKFKTKDEKFFLLKEFDFITNYINKYPKKTVTGTKEDDILFWTLRDINALKRNRTFVQHFGNNTLIVDKRKLDYYIYIDVFKRYSNLIPYYYGNLDVFINNKLFQKYKEYFIYDCLRRNEFLEKHVKFNSSISEEKVNDVIIEYFKILLGENYVYS